MVAGNILSKVVRKYSDTCVRLSCWSEKSKAAASIMMIAVVVCFGTENAHAGAGSYGAACNKLLGLIEGAFGALVAAAAGVAAIIAAALGGFKMAWSLVVVSIGSFVLRAYIGLFNGQC